MRGKHFYLFICTQANLPPKMGEYEIKEFSSIHRHVLVPPKYKEIADEYEEERKSLKLPSEIKFVYV